MQQVAAKRAAAPTELAVRNLPAQPKRYTRWFGHGLGVRVSPGGQRTFVYWFSWAGKKRLLTLGEHPALSVKEAIAAHAEARASAKKGVDPAAAKQAAKAAALAADATRAQAEAIAAARPTLRSLVDEFAERVLAHKASGKETLRQIEKDIVPALGADKPIEELRRRDAVLVVDAVRERGARIGNAAIENFSRLGNFAVERGLLESNPFANLKKVSIPPKTRVLADWEVTRLLARLPNVGLHPITVLALQMVLATGQRPGEVAGMTKTELSADGTMWTIPADRYKTGVAQHVPLTALAQRLLAHAAAYNHWSAYVFPSPQALPPTDKRSVARRAMLAELPADRPLDPHALPRAVQRKLGAATPEGHEPAAGTLGMAAFTPHDLRRTCRTGLAALGVSDHIAERAIGHKLQGVLAIYNLHGYLDERRAALELWGAKLDALDGRAPNDGKAKARATRAPQRRTVVPRA